MRSLGIDIGRYSIKVVEILANNRKYEVTNAKEYKIFNMESSDQEIDIMQTLNTISKEFDTDNAKVVCSIRQQYVSTRKLFFPFKERAKIHKSLAFELEDDIPLAIDKAIYDSKVIKFHDKSAEVVAMACVSEEVEKTLEIFEHGHIDPDIIAPEFCGVANLYEKWFQAPEEIARQEEEITAITRADKLIVHIGHTKTFVGVIREDNLIWGRSVMWGAEKIASSISQAFQVPFSAAHEMMPDKAFVLLTSGDANKDQLKMSDTIKQSLDPIVQALRLSIMLANTDYGANIQSIELIGGPSHIKNLAGYLTQELERPTNIANPLNNSSLQLIQNHQQLGESFIMAFGLAIEGLRRPLNPAVNFRQEEFAKKNLSFEKFWEKWGYTAKIVAAAYVCFFIYGIAIDNIAVQLESASYDVLSTQAKNIMGPAGRKVSKSSIRKYINSNKKKAKLVEVYDQLEEINSPIKFINDVSQILPSNKSTPYEVRRFVVDNAEVHIQGLADTSQTINNLQKALKGIAMGGKVNPMPSVIPKEANKQPFAFKFKVKRKN